MSLQAGLVSITFRRLSPAEIIELVKQTPLTGIEWGGDIHVPHGDVKRAAEAGRMTREAGLAVSAYGSYYGNKDGLVFERVLDSAIALGAPLIRIWAGRKGSASAAPGDWERIIDDTRRIAAATAAAGRQIAFEFHGNTLNDSPESCVKLLQSIGHPAVFTYWQPPAGAGVEDCLTGLKTVLPWLKGVHVFHWEPGHTRQPLAAGAQRWPAYLRLLRKSGAAGYASLEFVRDDSPQAFLEDAKTLAGWL
jgi:sugar phosphate isomerase/epimerase